MTSSSARDDIEALRAEVDRLRVELDARRGQTEREVERVKSSTSYQLGATLIGLRHLQGWRRLPHSVRDLVSRSRRVGSGQQNAVPAGAPRRAAALDVSAATILDEFSEWCFAPELDTRAITPSTARAAGTDLLLAESAWLGKGSRWRHQFSGFEPGNALDKTLHRCERAGVPTIFWNKEDPVHFETFCAAALRFDVIATTDEGCVPKYRALGHERVGVVPFAAQPAFHNPMGNTGANSGSICFAGAWRGDIHPQREPQLTQLLDAAQAVGRLTIFARPAGPFDAFPTRYQKAIRGSLPYADMVDEYRRHSCFLNVNTVTDSGTMMSRRVFELLACRTPVVSAPSRAIEQLFEGLIPMPTSPSATRDELSRMLSDPTYRDRVAHLGYRVVMRNHLYRHRLVTMLDLAGLDDVYRTAEIEVDGLCVVDPGDVDQTVSRLRPLVGSLRKLVILVRESAPRCITVEPGIELISCPPDETFVDHLRPRSGSTDSFVALLDHRSAYGSAMIADATTAMEYTTADVLGKALSHRHDETGGVVEIGHGTEYAPATELVRGTVLATRSRVLQSADGLRSSAYDDLHDRVVESAHARGDLVFSVDRFNHVAPGPNPAAPDGASDVLF